MEQSENNQGDFEGFDPFLLLSYRFLRKKTEELIKGRKVLDYGCGNGVHDNWLADGAGKVVAVDLSEESLNIASRRVKKGNIEFLEMDCENLTFEDNSFDLLIIRSPGSYPPAPLHSFQ